MEKDNFERLNWSNPVEARITLPEEKSFSHELSIVQKQSDEARINILRTEIADFAEPNIDSELDEVDHIVQVRERKINDARNIFGEDSFYANLIR